MLGFKFVPLCFITVGEDNTIKIGLGGNFIRENYTIFPALLDYLTENSLGPDKLFDINFAAVMQVTDPFSRTEFHSGCASSNEPWHAEAVAFLREEIYKHGYPAGKVTPSPCMVDINDAFVIHCDGGIYKCVALIGHEQYQVGDVWEGVKDYTETYNVDSWKKEEKCRNCAYLPLCFGGCRYSLYQRTDSMDGVDCMDKYFDIALEPMLLQDVRYRYKR